MSFKFISINHTTLLVKDKIASFAFYHNILGFEKYENTKSLWLVIGSQFVHISDTSGKPPELGFTHFAVLVEKFESYLNSLQEKSVSLYVLDEHGDLSETSDTATILLKQQFFVRDLDGNLLEFLDIRNSYFNPK
jgi:catechol 2,3-dioxygenase-like lactoylglutathione lyase family enzyme